LVILPARFKGPPNLAEAALVARLEKPWERIIARIPGPSSLVDGIDDEIGALKV
jgi:hypothetical protein